MRVDQNLRPNHIVLLTVLNAQYPIDVQIISKVTQPIGKVLRIVVFKRGNIVQSMVEFDDIQIATAAKNQLHGCDIYSGSCTLKVEFAKTDRLNVKRNDDMTWDYTDESALPQGSFEESGQEREEDQRNQWTIETIDLITTILGEPVFKINIVEREMREMVLLLEKVFPMPLEDLTHEITHERDEEGKYTLALSVGDQEVARVDVDSQILRNLTNIKPNTDDIENVVILDKP